MWPTWGLPPSTGWNWSVLLEQEYRLDIEDSQIGPQTRVSDLRQIITKREKLTRHNHFRFWTNARFFRGLRMAWDDYIPLPLVPKLCHPRGAGPG